MEPLTLSPTQAADLLGVSDELVRQWLDQGVLPEVTRVSRRRLIPRQAVEQLVEAAMDGWDPATAVAEIRRPDLRAVR